MNLNEYFSPRPVSPVVQVGTHLRHPAGMNYMLAHVGGSRVQAICLDSGDYYATPEPVNNLAQLSASECERVCGCRWREWVIG